MNVSRHVAKDMRSALALVRDLHGPDAVILSNKKVAEGIEITAAVDYDESLLEQPETKAKKYTFPDVDQATDQVDQTEELIARTQTSTLKKPKFEYTPARPQAQALDDLPELDFKVELSGAVRNTMTKQEAELPVVKDTFKGSEKAREIEKYLAKKEVVKTIPQTIIPEKIIEERTQEEVWTQDSLLEDMRKELHSLKSLVETQISGFAWGEMSRKAPVRAGVLRKLVALGLTPGVARHIAYRIQEDLGHRKAWYRALAMFARQVPIAGDTILTDGGVVALVGPAGVGKTTLIAKLAVQYAVRHGRENVALITTDSQRFGAFDQLKNLGSVLKIPVRAVGSEQELQAALDGFLEKPLVLIDSAGLSYRDKKLAPSLKMIKSSTPMLKAYMVLSATIQADALQQMIEAFKPVDPCGCMITKVDESTSLGPVLSAVVEHKLPITYYSEGQNIPDDLKISQIQDLVGKAVAISKSMNAFDRTEDLMMEQMLKGEIS